MRQGSDMHSPSPRRGEGAFSVHYHPEASPGPQDSFYLFQHLVESMR